MTALRVDLDMLMRYENGELSMRETVELFADLVKNDIAFALQGHYGREAIQLIDMGFFDIHGVIDEDRLESLSTF